MTLQSKKDRDFEDLIFKILKLLFLIPFSLGIDWLIWKAILFIEPAGMGQPTYWQVVVGWLLVRFILNRVGKILRA